jgi:ADP-ribose pyrophosphatase YjhB (NUDIX family)
MYRRRISVRGIIYKDGKVFAQKLKSPDGENNYWSTPGGGLDDGEDILHGLHREMIEETGVAPDIGNLLYIQQFHDGEKEQMEFFFHIKNADDYETVDLASTSHGLIEVSTHGFIDPKTEHILPGYLQTVDIADAVKSMRPVQVISYLK